MLSEEDVINLTKKWVKNVVIDCNFCPFAAKEFRNDTIYYKVEFSLDNESCLQSFFKECERLDLHPEIETTLFILPNAVPGFLDYLDLVSLAEQLLAVHDYEGTYQVASFHPAYLFEGSTETDPANYTNRSTFPMLQILREESIEKALEKFPDPESIPERNIKFAREKGIEVMKRLIE
jgi:hypothetical protein